MKKAYYQPDIEIIEIGLMDVLAISTLPTNNPAEYEIPILTRMKDDLAGGDGLSELPTEVIDE